MTIIQRSTNVLLTGTKVLFACSVLLTSSASIADSQTTWFGEVADGQWLAGIKLGAIVPDLQGYDDAATVAAVVIGYQFSRPIGDRGSASIELELGTSDTANISSSNPNGPGDYDIHTAGVYFNYRSPGTVYFKGKVGILDSNIDSRFDSGKRVKSNDASLALGLGFGVHLGGEDGRTTIEAEWLTTSGDNDINYYNLGANFAF